MAGMTLWQQTVFHPEKKKFAGFGLFKVFSAKCGKDVAKHPMLPHISRKKYDTVLCVLCLPGIAWFTTEVDPAAVLSVVGS